jgi:hypothetical protein
MRAGRRPNRLRLCPVQRWSSLTSSATIGRHGVPPMPATSVSSTRREMAYPIGLYLLRLMTPEPTR